MCTTDSSDIITYHFPGVHLKRAVSLRTDTRSLHINIARNAFASAFLRDRAIWESQTIADERAGNRGLSLCLTYLSSSELFVLLRMEGRCPAMKRNSFYREIPFNTHTYTRTHLRWKAQFRIISRDQADRSRSRCWNEHTMESRKSTQHGYALDRRTRQLHSSHERRSSVMDTLILFFDNRSILKSIARRIKSLSARSPRRDLRSLRAWYADTRY